MKIKTLNLFTNVLETQKEFYSEVLGLELLDVNKAYFTVRIGETMLKFQNRQKEIPSRYHFAINIPANQIEEAKIWLEEHVFLMLDPKTADEIFTSAGLNAKSIYFYDIAGNIIELIAREGLSNSSESFSLESLKCISEIGIPSGNVKQVSELLKSKLSLEEFNKESDELFSLGDSEGAFVVIQEKNLWYPTPFESEGHPFSCSIETANGDFNLIYNGKKLVLA